MYVQNVPVYTGVRSVAGIHGDVFERTHDDVLNLHTGFFSVSHTTHTTHTTSVAILAQVVDYSGIRRLGCCLIATSFKRTRSLVGRKGSVKCCSGMAPEDMHNVEGLLAVARRRVVGRAVGTVAWLRSWSACSSLIFSHKLNAVVACEIRCERRVFVHELVLRVVPVAQPPSVQLEVSQENLCH